MSTATEIMLVLKSADDIFLKNTGLLNGNRFLNDTTEEFIIEAAARIPRRLPIDITVHIPSSEIKRADDISSAIHKHFAYCRKKSQTKIKATLHAGRRTLLIGFLFLIIIYSLAHLLRFYFSTEGFFGTIWESLTILAWVALWRPAELLLYEWYPYVKEANLYKRLELSHSLSVISYEREG